MPYSRLSQNTRTRHSTSPPSPTRNQPDALTPAQALGNQIMQSIQPKLTVNTPNDPYEQEADRLASRVTSAPNVQRQADEPGKKLDDSVQAKPLASQVTPLVQRKDAKKDDEKKAQRAAKDDHKKKDDDKKSVQKLETNAPKTNDDESKAQRAAKDDHKKKDEPPKKKDDENKAQSKRKNAPQIDDNDDETMAQRAAKDDHKKKDDDKKSVQKKGDESAVAPNVASDIERMQQGGRPLDPAARSYFEPRFGADFSKVRVHDDAEAAHASEALNAQAFTQGEHIFFNSGRYQPGDTPGRQLMAHELTHTLQQGAASPAPPQTKTRTPTLPAAPVVQRANGAPPAAPAPAAAGAQATAEDPVDATQFDFEDGKLIGDTIVWDKLAIPTFKATEAHRAARYKIPYGTHGNLARRKKYKRGNPNQREKWQNEIDKGAIDTAMKAALKRDTGPDTVDPARRYVLRVPTSGGQPLFFFGLWEELKKEMTTPSWGGEKETPPQRTMQVDHIAELQVANWDASPTSEPNTLANMELLNRAQNSASGGQIDANIIRKVKQFNQDTNNRYAVPNPPPPTPAAETAAPAPKRRKPRRPRPGGVEPTAKDQLIMDNFQLEFKTFEPGPGPTVSNDEFWKKEDIQAAKHLKNSVHVASLKGVGNSTEVFLFTRRMGGEHRTYSWPDKAIPDNEANWFRPFKIVGKHFNTNPEQVSQPNFGTLDIQFRAPPLKGQQEINTMQFDVERIEGAQYAGYINWNKTKGSLNSAAEAFGIGVPKLSPVSFDETDLLGNGIYLKGRIHATIPVLGGAEIDFELKDGDFRAYKTFSANDIAVPKPLQISAASLTLAVGTRSGLSATGRVDFGIERVGKGFFEASAGTAAGFVLAGSFDFDSKLFDPANITMRYENGEFSGQGTLGIPPGKVRGIRSAHLAMAYAQGRFTANGVVQPNVPGVREGTLSLVYSEAEGLVISGTLQLAENPAIRSGSLEARVERKPDGSYKVAARGTAEPAIPNVNSRLTVAYDDGAFEADVTADFSRGMIYGSLHAAATNRPIDPATGQPQPNGQPTDKITVYGGGSVTVRFAPWLQGTAAIKLLPNGEIELTGSVGLPSAVNIFDARRFDRNIFHINIDIPIVGVSVLGHNIGIFATIGGGLDLTAGIGPGQIRDLGLTVEYNPAHEENTHVTGHGELYIPADAGLRLSIRGGLGAGIPIVDARAGIEVSGQLGLEGAARAAVDVDWTPQRGIVLDAVGEVFVEPKLKFNVSAFVEVTADLLFDTIDLYSQRWTLAQYEYGSNLRFGVRFPVHYEENRPFEISMDNLEFTVPEIDPSSVLSGILGL